MIEISMILYLALSQEAKPADVKAEPVQKTQTAERCVSAAEKPDERIAPQLHVSPGMPPLFSFRYYEGKQRQRFANLGLMLDDAGH